MRIFKALQTLILNTLFPPVCTSCKREGDFFCTKCLSTLKIKRISGHSAEKGAEFKSLNGVIYAADYAKNPALGAAIKQLKYKFTKELADYFGDLMSQKLSELSMVKGRRVILIPVPLHKKRLGERGFNQADLLARVVKHGEVVPLLERVRYTSQQAKLNKTERHKNLKDAFFMNNKFVHKIQDGDDCPQVYMSERGPNWYDWGERKKGERKKLIKKETGKKKKPIFFLVDDVCTTGSTLENCAEVLKRAGIDKVYGLVIARAVKC